ncbi:hypothetical protein [Nocardia asteroides]
MGLGDRIRRMDEQQAHSDAAAKQYMTDVEKRAVVAQRLLDERGCCRIG